MKSLTVGSRKNELIISVKRPAMECCCLALAGNNGPRCHLLPHSPCGKGRRSEEKSKTCGLG